MAPLTERGHSLRPIYIFYFEKIVLPGIRSSLFNIRFSARFADFMATWSIFCSSLLPPTAPVPILFSIASCEGRAAVFVESSSCSITVTSLHKTPSRPHRLPPQPALPKLPYYQGR